MAARGKKMDDSSSSDEVELRRCQDAVWETPSDKKKGGGFSVMFVVWKLVSFTALKDKY